MRLVILKDTRITNSQFLELQEQFSSLYRENTKITPTFYIENFDFSDYPTFVDNDGDYRPTNQFLQSTCSEVHKRYGKWGTDHIVLLIHEDNWKSDPLGDKGKGIWGTNYSNIFFGYQVQYCRFDKDNIANSLGVLYHEVHHSHDALIYAMLGIDVVPMLKVGSWDRDITHGNREPWKYIRHRENTASIEYIAPYLKLAYAKRKSIHDRKVSLMERVVILARQFIRKKNGITQ